MEAISLLRKAAEKEATESNEKLEASDQNLVAASTAQKDASDRLKAALRDVQREGLAGAFTQKAEAIAKQATTQQWIFGGAVTYLAVVATLPWVIEAWNGLNPSVEQFGLRFMRTLAIAAPGIWIGWVSSRKLGALNRILADYEYKSATALAYESYRKEVDDAGNDSLREKLLATAIENFGENPTEHYESAKAEPAAPIEAITAKLLERLPTLSTKQAVS